MLVGRRFTEVKSVLMQMENIKDMVVRGKRNPMVEFGASIWVVDGLSSQHSHSESQRTRLRLPR